MTTPTSTALEAAKEAPGLTSALGFLPCPFCGSHAGFSFGNDGDVVNVRCSKWGSGCLGAGPNEYSRDKAREGWNRRAALAQPEQGAGWLPIESAPRNSSRVLVATPERPDDPHRRRVFEAWWRIPFEGAPNEHGYWCYDGNGTLLDHSVHGIGATHWKPIPTAPTPSAR